MHRASTRVEGAAAVARANASDSCNVWRACGCHVRAWFKPRISVHSGMRGSVGSTQSRATSASFSLNPPVILVGGAAR